LLQPLLHDKHNEPSKEKRDEDLLRDLLKKEIYPVSGVYIVEPLEEHSEGHLGDAHDDGELHFLAVEPQDGLVRLVPHWIHAEGLHTVFICRHGRGNPVLDDATGRVGLPARVEQGDA